MNCNLHHISRRIHDGFDRGFTLVETALALGIVSFALVALLGTLPVGLQASHNAASLNFSTLIGQQLIGLIQQSNSANYGTLESTYYYFDDQGQPLALTATGSPPASALYTASIQPAQTENANTLIGDDLTANAMASLQITIVIDPGHSLQGTPNAALPPNLQGHSMVIPVFMAINGNAADANGS